MIWRAVILSLALLAAPASAQDTVPRDFDGVMAALETTLASGDPDTPFVMLNRAIRTARAEGRLTADWSIFFAMLADYVRNQRGNPAFALSLIDEGMALIAGMPDQADFASTLQISGAYALADLGRMEEAVDQARLGLPLFRVGFGDAAADELLGYMEQWAAGEFSVQNTSAIDLSIAALDRAQAAFDIGAYGRSVAQAAMAILPEVGDLPPGQVRLVNARAQMYIGDGLRLMNRTGDAANAYVRSVNHMADGGWTPGTPPVWWPEAMMEFGGETLSNALRGVAGLALQSGDTDLARTAATLAEPFVQNFNDRVQILLIYAVVSDLDEDRAGALALIEQFRERGAEAGDIPAQLLADLYAAQVRVRMAQAAGEPPSSTALIAAIQAILASADEFDVLRPADMMYEAARFLVKTDDRAAALDYARRALALRRARAAEQALRDSGFGQAQARKAQRGTVETFLRAANNAAVEADPTCEDPSRFAWYGCLTTQQPPQ